MLAHPHGEARLQECHIQTETFIRDAPPRLLLQVCAQETVVHHCRYHRTAKSSIAGAIVLCQCDVTGTLVVVVVMVVVVVVMVVVVVVKAATSPQHKDITYTTTYITIRDLT